MAHRGKLEGVLRLWQIAVRDLALSLVGAGQQPLRLPAPVTNWTISAVLRVEERIRHALRFLPTNVQSRLLVEDILLSIP